MEGTNLTVWTHPEYQAHQPEHAAVLLHTRHLTIFLRPRGRRTYWRMIHCAIDQDAILHQPEYFYRFWNYWTKKWRLPPQGPELIGFCMHTWLIIQASRQEKAVGGGSSAAGTGLFVPQDLFRLPAEDLPWRFQMTLPLTDDLSVWLGLSGNWSQVFPNAHFWHPFQGLVRLLHQVGGRLRVRATRVLLCLYDAAEAVVWLFLAGIRGRSPRYASEFFTSMEQVQSVEDLFRWLTACQIQDVYWLVLYLPEAWQERLQFWGKRRGKKGKVTLVWSPRQVPQGLHPVHFAWKSLLELPVGNTPAL